MNKDFVNNNFDKFLSDCHQFPLVIIGGNRETSSFMDVFMKDERIHVEGQINTIEHETIYPKIDIERLIETKKDIVVLITDKHPFLWQKKLLEIHIYRYYSSFMFVERFVFENNTSFCRFYLDD